MKQNNQAVAVIETGEISAKIQRKRVSKTVKNGEITIASASDYSGNTAIRRDIAGSITRTDRYKNIEDGLVPFRYSSTIYGGKRAMIDVRDAVILCQKCYYNFAIFRNIIDLMTEFSIGELYFKGGSEKSRDFFKALFNKIYLVNPKN